MASMMWQPDQDPAALTTEFLVGYFGQPSAPHMHDYLTSMLSAAATTPTAAPAVTAFPWTPSTNNPWNWAANGPAFLGPACFPHLLQANAAMAAALAAAAGPVQKGRVSKAWMAVLLPTLWRWDALHAAATASNTSWPLPPTKQEGFRLFAAAYTSSGAAGLVNVNFSPCGVPGWAKVKHYHRRRSACSAAALPPALSSASCTRKLTAPWPPCPPGPLAPALPQAANGTTGWPQPGACVYECSLLWLHECLFTSAGPAGCPPTGHVSCPNSRRRDCHFTDTPVLSLLKHLLKVEGGAAE